MLGKTTSFVAKLWELMEASTKDAKIATTIRWTPDGQRLQLGNLEKFELVTLPQYFNHNKMSSFVRQLNNYGFAKAAGELEYGSKYFVKNKPELLPLCTKRRRNVQTVKLEPEPRKRKPEETAVPDLQKRVKCLESSTLELELRVEALSSDFSVPEDEDFFKETPVDFLLDFTLLDSLYGVV